MWLKWFNFGEKVKLKTLVILLKSQNFTLTDIGWKLRIEKNWPQLML